MSIHLVGGGPLADVGAAVTGRFVAEATARATAVGRTTPRIAVLAVGGGTADASDLVRALGDGGPAELVVHGVTGGESFATSVLSDIDGLVVAGGRTPDYLTAIAPLVDQIRLLVADALPYLGFSAGAMIASDRALAGGWRIGGVEICPEDAAEGLDEVTLSEGLGLVDLTIDVHAVQAGTLARLIAATEAGFVQAGLAIDEDTVLVVGEGALEVRGAGSVWRVISVEDGEGESSVSVATMGA